MVEAVHAEDADDAAEETQGENQNQRVFVAAREIEFGENGDGKRPAEEVRKEVE